jgi:hypothetical protein
MANLDLAGQVPAELDHRLAVTLTNLSVRKSTPTVVKKGAVGVIGTAQGIPDVTGSFKLAAPKTGLEIDLDALGSKPGGFTLTYSIGTMRFAVLGCRFSEDDISVDNGAGNVEVSVSFTGTERIRLS